MTFVDAKQRFSSRVADYVRYRPGYPPALVDLLRAKCGLLPHHQIADIGSGTGFLSKLFLRNGNIVFAVEPNHEMREAGDEFLASYGKFLSFEGSAESTGLADACIDLIAVGQAFHWFAPIATRREFIRILRPQGWVALIWNQPLISETAFSRAYEDLLVRYGTDYAQVKAAYPETRDMENFFGEGNFQRSELPNFQEFDFDGLAGRLRSSSYAPKEGHANYAPMLAALRELFEANQDGGRVRMIYNTQIYLGQLEAMRNAG